MGGRHGEVGGFLHTDLGHFVVERDLGIVLMADTQYEVIHDPRTILKPDVSFISSGRLPIETWPGIVPLAPDFAAEVASPSNRQAEIMDKVGLYLEGGTRMVWVVRPEQRTVTVFRPDRPERIFRIGDELDGEDVFPGYRLLVDRIFQIRGRRIP